MPKFLRPGSLIVATSMLVVVLGASSAGAFASPAPEPTRPELQSEARAVPTMGFTVLAGLALPACHGLGCYGAFGPAPSVQAQLLYQPNETWAFGLVGQVERVHWQATAYSMAGGTPYVFESDVTGVFGGLGVRFVPLPQRPLTLVVQLALGSAFQLADRPYDCSTGLAPAAQLALGGRLRVSSSISSFAMASVRGAIADSCFVFDAPTTPFAAWGFGFHVGAAFDFAVNPN